MDLGLPRETFGTAVALSNLVWCLTRPSRDFSPTATAPGLW